MKKIYDLLWRKTGVEGKTRWEKVGVLINRGDKMSIKINLVPAGNWDGWLVATERKKREEPF